MTDLRIENSYLANKGKRATRDLNEHRPSFSKNLRRHAAPIITWNQLPRRCGKSGHSRNGKSAKTLKGSFGTMPLEVPRDRNGTFEPQIIEKHQTRFTGFDQNIIRCMRTRLINPRDSAASGRDLPCGSLAGLDLERDGRVIDEVKTWQNRQLDAVYPIMYLDAIQFKVRDGGHVRNKAIYLAIAITVTGMKEVFGVVDRADRRGQVLAASSDRAKE